MKKSTPRTFTGLARSGGGSGGANSGIFSNSGRGQKMDGPSRSSPLNEKNSDGDRGALKYAVTVPQKKHGSKVNGVTNPGKLQDYALNHGEGRKK